MLFTWLCSFTLYISTLASAQTVTLTSSVEQAGRQAACPGEEVTFTCTATEAGGLQWSAEPFINQTDPVTFTIISPSGDVRDRTAEVHILLEEVSPASDQRLRNFVSILTVRNSTELSRILIHCNGGDMEITANKTLITGTPPSSPQSLATIDTVYGINDFTVTVQWESPASDGGVGIDSYTLTGAGITVPLTVLSNEPLMATLTLSYNELHMVSVTASNCAGESTATVVTILEATAAVATTGLTTAEAVGIAVALSSVVSFTAGLSVALAIAHCYHSTQQRKVHSDSPSNGQQVVPMYEDVSMVVGGDIELKENLAYRTVVI